MANRRAFFQKVARSAENILSRGADFALIGKQSVNKSEYKILARNII